VAPNVIGKTPVEAGTPERTPVSVPKLIPVGKAPLLLNVDTGKPEAVTVKLHNDPTTHIVLSGLVIAGASFTNSVKF